MSIEEVRNYVKDKTVSKDWKGKELEVAQEVLDNPTNLTVPQTIALADRKVVLKDEILKLTEEINKYDGEGSYTKTNDLRLQRDALQNEFNTITDAGQVAGNVQSAEFRARQNLKVRDYDLPEYKARARSNKGKDLTPLQEENIDLAHKELVKLKKEELAQIEADIVKEQQRYAEIAEKTVLAEQAITDKLGKNRTKRAKLRQERADIKKEIMDKTGLQVYDITGITVDGLYTIGKLAINYIKDGALKGVAKENLLKEITKIVQKDIPSLTEAEVARAIATKDPKLVKRQIAETTKQKNFVEMHARLVTEVSDGINGLLVRKAKNKRPVLPHEIQALKKKLREIDNSLRESGLDQRSIEKAQRRIDTLIDQIENNFRPVKPPKKITSEALAKKKQTIKDLTAKKNQIDAILTLEEKIREAKKGRYPEPAKRKQQNETIKKLRKELNDLIPKHKRPINPLAKSEALRKKIASLKDQYEKDYRLLKRYQEPPTIVEAELKRSISELNKLINAKDRLSDIEYQKKTGKFKVLEPKVEKYVSPELQRAQTRVMIARREMMSMVEGMKVHTGFGNIARHYGVEIANTLRTLRATADMSYTLKQGLVLSTGSPKLAGEAFTKAFKALNEFEAEQILNAIKQTDEYLIGQQHKLHISEIGNTFGHGEEMFMSSWAEKIPGYGSIVKASERHMITGLNVLRQGRFNEFLEKYPNASKAQLSSIANWINVSSGVGNLGKFGAIAPEAGFVFFAPKYSMSRLQMPFELFKNIKDPKLRKTVGKEIVKDMTAYAGFMTATLMMAKMSGLDIGTDPRDADFMKIRTGDTRIDVSGGMIGSTRFIMNMWTNLADANNEELLKSERQKEWTSTIGNYLKYKFSPFWSTAYELGFRKNLIGQEIKPTDLQVPYFGRVTMSARMQSLARSITPMVVESFIDGWKNENLKAGIMGGTFDFFGAATSNYPDSQSKVRRMVRQAVDAGNLPLAKKMLDSHNQKHPEDYIGYNVLSTMQVRINSAESDIKDLLLLGKEKEAKALWESFYEEFNKKGISNFESLQVQAKNTQKNRNVEKIEFNKKIK